MDEDQLKEERKLLDKSHLSAGPLLSPLNDFVVEHNDSQSLTSNFAPYNTIDRKEPRKRFYSDYLVFGYHGREVQQILQDQPLFFELYEVLIESSSTKPFHPPWSEEPLLLHERENLVNIVMSPFTSVIGTANRFECFCEDSFHKFDFGKKRKVRVLTSENFSKIEVFEVKGIVVPKDFPNRDDLQICRKILSPLLERANEHHFISSGIALRSNCNVKYQYHSEETIETIDARAQPTFFICNLEFEKSSAFSTKRIMHQPPKFKKLPDFCFVPARIGAQKIPGLLTKISWIPFLFLGLLLLSIAIPGVIQNFLSEDRKIGDILNACIGVGSVIFGAFLSTFYCMINTTVNVWKGEFVVTNNFAARIFVRRTVKYLESMACDPRLPRNLVEDFDNCAVRCPKNGWIAIGQEIKFDDMINHGYYIVREKGLVIDLIECREIVCLKKKDDVIVHLVRSMEEQKYLFEHVDSFKGDEKFGGLNRNRSPS